MTHNAPATIIATRFLALDDGRIAYDDTKGNGPLVVLLPGIGDLRAEYRFVAPALARPGYRVVTMDLRGFGESDTTFTRYDGEAVGLDLIALLRHLDAGPAVIVGTSMAAGSVVYAAAEAPQLVSRVVLVGGFTRDAQRGAPMNLLIHMLMAGPWRAAVWMGLHGTLFPLSKPEDHEAHRKNIRASLREPGRSAAFGQMMVASHAYAEARYDKVRAPSLFVMGTADSDFPDPVREAAEVSRALGGDKLLIEGAGHYPHVEAPEPSLAGVLPFLSANSASAKTA
ncbi:MAG: alpha/beta hydrolase [Nannocystaceae bacterium]